MFKVLITTTVKSPYQMTTGPCVPYHVALTTNVVEFLYEQDADKCVENVRENPLKMDMQQYAIRLN